MDVGIIEKDGDRELAPKRLDDMCGAWGAADVQQQAGF
jgi:hypothetical protein